MKQFRSVINIDNLKTKEDILSLNNNYIKPIKPPEITTKKLHLVVHSLHRR